MRREALDWIGEVEVATSLVELNDAGSATGKAMPAFEVCGPHECEQSQTKSTRDLQKASCLRRRNSIYSAAKATRNDISNKCWAAGYRFWPIVHEIQGGMAKDADAAMRAIYAAVGEKENTDAMAVCAEFLGRLAAVTTRAATRAVQKRTTKKCTGTAPDLPATTVRQVLRAMEPEIDREEELEFEGL